MRFFVTASTAKKNIPIFVILATALLVRLIGIGFGQPLWVVGDEPSFIFGALKMIELRTILPSLHDTVFMGLLYYPPFLCYIEILPFLLLIGAKFLFFNGTIGDFKNYLLIDLTDFFILARCISVAIGCATVWLVYKIGKNIFKNEIVGLASASFLTLSLLHVNFSHWARHWTFSTFFFALIICILSSESSELSRRYRSVVLFCALGVGITLPIIILSLFIAMWFLYYERASLRAHIRKVWFWQALIGAILLIAAAYSAWPRGFYVAHNATHNSFLAGKTFIDFFRSYSFYAVGLIRGEPVMSIFGLIGCLYGIKNFRKYIISSVLFIFIYIAIFYLFFLQTDRFILILYPLFTTIAGYGFAMVVKYGLKYSRQLTYFLIGILVILQGFFMIKFDYLLAIDDTRVQAREWIEENIPEKSKIVVLTSLMRLPSTADAIQEQGYIDSASLRSIDRAEAELSDSFFKEKRYHALNLNSVNSSTLYRELDTYIFDHKYEYIVYSSEFAAEKGVTESLLQMLGSPLKTFTGYKSPASHVDSIVNGFGGGIMEVLKSHSIGPTVTVYKLDTRKSKE